MRKLRVLVLFYISLFSLSIFLHSCCTNPTKISIIGGGDLTFQQAVELPVSVNNPVNTDTIIKEPFSIYANMEVLYASSFMDQAFISSAYGTSCDDEFQNSMVESSFTFTCDQDFMFDGETIEAGSNELGELIGVTKNIGLESVSVFLEQEFIDKVAFTNGQTTFTMTIQTSDNVELESVGTVMIAFD